MSAIDQALDHARVAERMGDMRQRDFWAKEAVRFLYMEGPPLPPSTVEAKLAGFQFTCSQCITSEWAPDVAGLMDIADQHRGCGGPMRVWHCPTCDHVEFKDLQICRFCGSDRGADAEEVQAFRPGVVTDQRCTYVVEDRDTKITCGSLLRAQRAARAMYPGQQLRIRMACSCLRWKERGRRAL
jgi:hypothetical protein